ALRISNGPIAVISAGMQEAEGDIGHVQEAVGLPLSDLHLYHRAQKAFQEDTRLREAYRQRQEHLKDQQRLYRLRLKQLAIAARTLLAASGEADMLAAEQRHAIAQLRALDRHHLQRTETLHDHFEQEFGAEIQAALGRHVDEIREVVDSCQAILITGGNVAILLDRLRLFGMTRLLRQKPVVAWSAGAMALAERVVLFHDRTPQGRRDPEVLGAGCGLLPGFVFLPDARHRLLVKNRNRIELFCRRFSPELCVALDSGSALQFEGARITAAEAVRHLKRDGRLSKLRVS
ncbi:MAG: Type 1 glutamine amidotransferase-like domain-containing protein, partial [Gammaproteobacteria bacterium]|nr:Type 1 glutamine amidotransferase-like domain-containing protein [Gammaproteobacteria bacterium]